MSNYKTKKYTWKNRKDGKFHYTIFSIEKNNYSNTLLNIYDISGRVVAELINEKYGHGSYSVTWNASSFSSVPRPVSVP